MYGKMFLAVLFFSFALFVSPVAASEEIGPCDYLYNEEECNDPYSIIQCLTQTIKDEVSSRSIRSRLQTTLDSCEDRIPGAQQGDIRSENYAIRYVEQFKMYVNRYMKTGNISGETDLLNIADDLIDAITCVDCYKDLKVFISSYTYYGDMGGISGADGICQELADDAGLSGTYKAWLSTSSGYSPADSWDHSWQDYELTDGTLIAEGWDDLVDGELYEPIWLDQYASYQSYETVWTGTNYDGYPAGDYGDRSEFCYDWTNWDGDAQVGYSGDSDEAWTDDDWEWCDYDFHIYCFEQVDPRWESRCYEEYFRFD